MVDNFDEKCEEAIKKAGETRGFYTFTHKGIEITAGRHSSVSGLRRIFDEEWRKKNEPRTD